MRMEMPSSQDHAVMARLQMFIAELIQILHRSMVHHMPGQDNHEVVPMSRKSFESLIEFHEVHAAER